MPGSTKRKGPRVARKGHTGRAWRKEKSQRQRRRTHPGRATRKGMGPRAARKSPARPGSAKGSAQGPRAARKSPAMPGSATGEPRGIEEVPIQAGQHEREEPMGSESSARLGRAKGRAQLQRGSADPGRAAREGRAQGQRGKPSQAGQCERKSPWGSEEELNQAG